MIILCSFKASSITWNNAHVVSDTQFRITSFDIVHTAFFLPPVFPEENVVAVFAKCQTNWIGCIHSIAFQPTISSTRSKLHLILIVHLVKHRFNCVKIYIISTSINFKLKFQIEISLKQFNMIGWQLFFFFFYQMIKTLTISLVCCCCHEVFSIRFYYEYSKKIHKFLFLSF